MLAKMRDQAAEIKAVCWVAMHHDQGTARIALGTHVDDVHSLAAYVQPFAVSTVTGWSVDKRSFRHRHGSAYHCHPNIMQFNPLPMPRKATRWPGCKNPRWSASAAVNGKDTVPMLPR